MRCLRSWGFGSSTVSGVLLLIVWILEFLIVTLLSVLVSFPSSKAPFCEETNKWFEQESLPAFQEIGDKMAVIKNLENGDNDVFNEIQQVRNSKEESHSIFVLYGSEMGKNYLSIENKIANYNDKNELEFEDEEVIEYISISDTLKNKLRESAKASSN